MTAVAYSDLASNDLSHQRTLASFSGRVVVPARDRKDGTNGSRHLEVVPMLPGSGCPRADRIAPSVYYKRRLAAAVIVLLAIIAVSSGLWHLTSAAWDVVHNDSAAPKMVNVVATSDVELHTQAWTVQPGDTLWSIARSMKPEGDIRPVLNKLIEAYSDKTLTIGETITLEK